MIHKAHTFAFHLATAVIQSTLSMRSQSDRVRVVHPRQSIKYSINLLKYSLSLHERAHNETITTSLFRVSSQSSFIFY